MQKSHDSERNLCIAKLLTEKEPNSACREYQVESEVLSKALVPPSSHLDGIETLELGDSRLLTLEHVHADVGRYPILGRHLNFFFFYERRFVL